MKGLKWNIDKLEKGTEDKPILGLKTWKDTFY